MNPEFLIPIIRQTADGLTMKDEVVVADAFRELADNIEAAVRAEDKRRGLL